LGSDSSQNIKLRCEYALVDYSHNSSFNVFQQPSDIELNAIDDKLAARGSANGTTNLGYVSQVNNKGNGNGIDVVTISSSSEGNRWRVVFTGEDNCWIVYNRNHIKTKMVACNKMIPPQTVVVCVENTDANRMLVNKQDFDEDYVVGAFNRIGAEDGHINVIFRYVALSFTTLDGEADIVNNDRTNIVQGKPGNYHFVAAYKFDIDQFDKFDQDPTDKDTNNPRCFWKRLLGKERSHEGRLLQNGDDDKNEKRDYPDQAGVDTFTLSKVFNVKLGSPEYVNVISNALIHEIAHAAGSGHCGGKDCGEWWKQNKDPELEKCLLYGNATLGNAGGYTPLSFYTTRMTTPFGGVFLHEYSDKMGGYNIANNNEFVLHSEEHFRKMYNHLGGRYNDNYWKQVIANQYMGGWRRARGYGDKLVEPTYPNYWRMPSLSLLGW
jgi:hypothetical protein